MKSVTGTMALRAGLMAGALVTVLVAVTAGSARADCVRWSDAPGVIAKHKLSSPGAVRKQAMSRGGEVLSMDLCRQGNGYVYRLTIIGAGRKARDIVIDAGGSNGNSYRGLKSYGGKIGNYVKRRVRSYLRRYLH